MLKRIQVDNFKSLKHLEYDCVGLNLLCGLNGAGKSSFVQLLRLLNKVAPLIRHPKAEIRAGEICCGGFRELMYCYGSEPPRFNVMFTDESNKNTYSLVRRLFFSGRLSSQRGEWITVERLDAHKIVNYLTDYDFDTDARREYQELQESEHEGCVIPQEELDAARQRCEIESEKERVRVDRELARMNEEDGAAADVFLDMWRGFRFVDAFRQKPQDVHKGGNYSGVELMIDAVSEGALDVAFNPEGETTVEYLCKADGKILDKVNECLQWVSPGARMEISKTDVGDEEYLISSVNYGSTGKFKRFKPQNVGFGISYILPVLVVLLTAKRGNIIVVENPEAHLHPRGQAEFGKLIAATVARGVQIFVETHSDHVINGIRVAVKNGILKPEDVNVAFFERGPHDVVAKDGVKYEEVYSEVRNIKIDENGSLSEYPPDFMDEWNIQQMKLFRRK